MLQMHIMNFENWVSKMNESVRGEEMDRILDKISNGESLSDMENRFLNRFNTTTDNDFKDFSYLTRSDAFEKIRDILDNNKKVICDLFDSNGQIGIEILSIYNNFDTEKCYMILKNGEKIELRDNFLYNIIYSVKKDEYSLQSQDEYYERIPIKNED